MKKHPASVPAGKKHKPKQSGLRTSSASQHLSTFAAQQLLAQGVSQRALNQIQAGIPTATAQPHNNSHGQAGSSNQPKTRKQLGNPKSKHQELLTSGTAALQARQDGIFSRLFVLEKADAMSSQDSCLQWQAPTIELQVCSLSGAT